MVIIGKRLFRFLPQSREGREERIRITKKRPGIARPFEKARPVQGTEEVSAYRGSGAFLYPVP